MNNILQKLPGAILPWYQQNKRDLPWRKDRDPYHIWLSEIMLQQTRVEAVKGYYDRFLAALPNIDSLASADDEQLHKLWEGLGYYSRVRNLKKAAQRIITAHNGVFPGEYDKVLALPGIGEYTAGAICSIAFGMRTPAVDGNVLRVVARLTDDSTPIDLPAYKKQVQISLAEIYPEQAGAFTQALMELGATVCGPNRKPDCKNCPCNGFCLGYQRNTADSLPVKSPKKERREEEYTVFILRCGDRYALDKRSEKGLLAGLWQFPNIAGKLELDKALSQIQNWGMSLHNLEMVLEREHIFTHITWKMRGIYAEVTCENSDFQWFTPTQIREETALPTAFRQFWNEIQHTAV